jgi:hypothetical protein
MQNLYVLIFGFALFAYALSRVPDKYKPVWSLHLKSWRTLIGLIAVILAFLIVINPEFYALGILGDSTFFDLLVLAIGIQLQVILCRVWCFTGPKFSMATRVMGRRYCRMFWSIIAFISPLVSLIHKAVSRMSS